MIFNVNRERNSHSSMNEFDSLLIFINIIFTTYLNNKYFLYTSYMYTSYILVILSNIIFLNDYEVSISFYVH